MQGEILLVKHSFGSRKWMTPGGGIKINESPEKAAVREIKEELGVEVYLKNLTKLHNEPLPLFVSGLLFRVYIFETTVSEVQSRAITPSHEILEWRWFSQYSSEVKKSLPKDTLV